MCSRECKEKRLHPLKLNNVAECEVGDCFCAGAVKGAALPLYYCCNPPMTEGISYVRRNGLLFPLFFSSYKYVSRESRLVWGQFCVFTFGSKPTGFLEDGFCPAVIPLARMCHKWLSLVLVYFDFLFLGCMVVVVLASMISPGRLFPTNEQLRRGYILSV